MTDSEAIKHADAALYASTEANSAKSHLLAADLNYKCAEAFAELGNDRTAEQYRELGRAHYQTATEWHNHSNRRAHFTNAKEWRRRT